MKRCMYKECGKTEEDGVILDYHTSAERQRMYGHGLWICPGHHKTLHRLEKKQAAKE